MRKSLVFFKLLLCLYFLCLTIIGTFGFAHHSSLNSAGGIQHFQTMSASSSSSSGGIAIASSSSSSGGGMASSSSSSSSGSLTGGSTSSSSLSSSSGSSSSGSGSLGVSSSSSSGGSGAGITTDTYILVQGKTAGIQLYTRAGLTEVIPDLNKNTLAKGSIFGPDENCSKPHYHGMLRLKNDPAPDMCGWGKVIEYNTASVNIQNASNATHLNLLALTDLSLTFDINDNYRLSLAHANDALSALNNLNTSISSLENKSRIENNIKCANKKTELASNALQNLSSGNEHKQDRKKLIKSLKGAIRCTRNAFRIIFIKEKGMEKKNGT